jgi:hypothetical protein
MMMIIMMMMMTTTTMIVKSTDRVQPIENMEQIFWTSLFSIRKQKQHDVNRNRMPDE